MPVKSFVPRRTVRSYGNDQEGEEWAPVIQPNMATPSSNPAPRPATPAFVPPVADMTSAPPVNELKPPPVAAPTFAGKSTEDAAKAREERPQPAANVGEAKQQEQAVKEPSGGFVDAFRGAEKAPPPTQTQVDAGVAKPPAPVATSAPMEEWRASLEPQMAQLADFQAGPVRPKPSSFVSFGDFAAQWDDSIRSGMAGAAQEAAIARESGRKAFSRALQQANEKGVDVEATDAYGEFLREQKRSEELLGSGMSGAPKGGSLIEEALRGIYSKQLAPIGESVRLQREGAMKTASQRNEQRAKAKASQEALPVNEPMKAPPPPARAQAQAAPETESESAMLDADAQDFAASFSEANGRGPTPEEFAARRKELLEANRRDVAQERKNMDQINRAMPGKL